MRHFSAIQRFNASGLEIVVVVLGSLGLLDFHDRRSQRVDSLCWLTSWSFVVGFRRLLLSMRKELLLNRRLHIVCRIRLIEHSQVVRDANQDHLRDVNLHEDKDLVQGAEDVSDARHVDPLGTVDAKQMLPRAGYGLPVDDELTCRDCQNGKDSKDEIAA